MEERTCKASPLPSAPSPLANGASAFASLPSSTALPPPLCARRRCERSRWCDSRSFCSASRSTARVAAATYGDGLVCFVGDDNGEEETVDLVARLATTPRVG